MPTKRWFITIIAFTALTLLTTYTISSDSPLIVFRYIFGFIFVSFIPGYSLVQLLFIKNRNVDLVEKVVLSVALSFSITSLVGLFLGLSSIGIGFTSVTVSLSAVVIFLSSLAFILSQKR
ncbi:MAG: DUF1616 domain-containing protein [Nitrososphaerota archaeon]|nr:DUF1616 domain-containing protein [Candidatus Bathyarchaeota archaeon]MDW8024025.1 DUF1616 domain-containing protein [Nitrososphaerota archaeon]MDW8040582.1 DUF1616 domain-containing protein [Nitrososphaerota archaeon]